MSTLQQRLAAIAETTANLKAQFRELDRLREHVRKAELRIATSGHCLRSGLGAFELLQDQDGRTR